MTNLAVALAVPGALTGFIGLTLVAASGPAVRQVGHSPTEGRRRARHSHGPGPGGTAPLITPSWSPGRYDTRRGDRACFRVAAPDWAALMVDAGERPARPGTVRGTR